MNREEMQALWAKVYSGTATPEEKQLLFDTVNSNRCVTQVGTAQASPITTPPLVPPEAAQAKNS